MSTLIWIEVRTAGRARRLAGMLESSGVDAQVSHSLRGAAGVLIRKPRLRRMKPFMIRVAAIVSSWLEEQVDTRAVVAQTVGRRFEIHSRIPHATRQAITLALRSVDASSS